MINLIYSGLITLAVTVLAFILKTVYNENRELKHKKDQAAHDREKALENGVVCLLRVKLIEYHSKYMEEKCISLHGYENWKLMYNAYHTLGGNGMIEHLKNDIEELKMKKC